MRIHWSNLALMEGDTFSFHIIVVIRFFTNDFFDGVLTCWFIVEKTEIYNSAYGTNLSSLMMDFIDSQSVLLVLIQVPRFFKVKYFFVPFSIGFF